METSSLDWALANFSGSIAADELYDGPFCVLSIVDNRTFKRLVYHMLDHDPTHADITAFFRRFPSALEQRSLRVQAITTDASPLYPEPIAQVFGAVPHQRCAFHVIKALTKAVLRAVAQVRKRLAAQHHLTAAERHTLQRITQGLPPLRSLRAIMDEVYRLFDRRCHTDTALAKLARLRQRVRRFRQVRRTLQKLFAANLEQALTFLDDSLLPSTSNAVERSNRRHRKMQKTVYRVRTQEHLTARIALDMLRDARTQDRQATQTTLHSTRAGQTR
jgi:hypothetical protein